MKNPVRGARWPGVLVVGVVVAACGAARASGEIRVAEAWARPGDAGETVGLYFTMTNPGDRPDRLLGGETPAAESVEIHETTMEGDVAHMMPVAGIDLPAGATVELRPGGFHVMLVGLRDTLEVGDRVPLTLRFEQSGPLEVEVEVLEQ